MNVAKILLCALFAISAVHTAKPLRTEARTNPDVGLPTYLFCLLVVYGALFTLVALA